MTKQIESKLEKGAVVRVYQKPMTAEDFEGEAVLHSFNGHSESIYYPDGINGQGRALESWAVRFNKGEPVYDRWVCSLDIVTTSPAV